MLSDYQKLTPEQKKKHQDKKNKKYREVLKHNPEYMEKRRKYSREKAKEYYKEKPEHKEKVLLRAKEYAIKNKDKIIERVSGRKKILLPWINSIKSGSGCTYCQEKDYRCLDFHHVDPSTKNATIAYMYAAKYSIETIIEEIEKCIILCANCHRKLHYNQKRIK